MTVNRHINFSYSSAPTTLWIDGIMKFLKLEYRMNRFCDLVTEFGTMEKDHNLHFSEYLISNKTPFRLPTCFAEAKASRKYVLRVSSQSEASRRDVRLHAQRVTFQARGWSSCRGQDFSKARH